MITRLLVGILTPAMRAIHPSPFRRRSARKVESRGNRLDVRWRPALAENPRTQKIPCAPQRRRDPERLQDQGDVERNFLLSREKWRSLPLLHRTFLGVTFPQAPSVDGDKRPDSLDQAKRPSPLQETVDGAEGAGAGKSEAEPRAPILQRVKDQHKGDGCKAKKGERIHGLKEAPRPRPVQPVKGWRRNCAPSLDQAELISAQ